MLTLRVMLRVNNQLTCITTLNAYLLKCFARVIGQFNGNLQEIFSRANTFDKTASSGLFLSTMISWNTEPLTNWKSFNTLKWSQLLKLCSRIQQSWFVTLCTSNSSSNVECRLRRWWERDTLNPFGRIFQLRGNEFFFWVFSLVIILVAFVIIVRYWITKAFSFFLSLNRKKKGQSSVEHLKTWR